MASVDTWDDECDWPRRLLHVPTMNSYSWKPGNTYGSHCNPSYNAISYSWGRWELKADECPGVGSLDVKGIHWRTPRINPNHFTVSEMLAAVQSASVESRPDPTEFLWLDIACIDQTPNSAENASEIGRQAKIFRRAKNIYAWLVSFDHFSFDEWLAGSIKCSLLPYLEQSQLDTNSGLSTEDSEQQDELVKDIHNRIQQLARDPWCTSLWTLQEAFLRPDAFIIVRRPWPSDRRPPDTEHAFNWMSLIMADGQQSGLAKHEKLQGIQQAIHRLGIIAACHVRRQGETVLDGQHDRDPTENPFNILASSASRQTSHQEDRVYAIMQVFDLQLGRSAPGATRTLFTSGELAQQLEDALLLKYPIASQLVIQPSDCRLGKAWMMQPGGIVSTTGETLWNKFQAGDSVSIWTKLSTQVHMNERWGYFQGPTVSFAALEDCFNIGVTLDLHWHEEMSRSDNSSALEQRVDEQVQAILNISGMRFSETLLRRNLKATAKQNFVASWVKQRFPQLQVVLLGTSVFKTGQTECSSTTYGVCLDLINGTSPACFRRIGTLAWSNDTRADDEKQIFGLTVAGSGLFG